MNRTLNEKLIILYANLEEVNKEFRKQVLEIKDISELTIDGVSGLVERRNAILKAVGKFKTEADNNFYRFISEKMNGKVSATVYKTLKALLELKNGVKPNEKLVIVDNLLCVNSSKEREARILLANLQREEERLNSENDKTILEYKKEEIKEEKIVDIKPKLKEKVTKCIATKNEESYKSLKGFLTGSKRAAIKIKAFIIACKNKKRRLELALATLILATAITNGIALSEVGEIKKFKAETNLEDDRISYLVENDLDKVISTNWKQEEKVEIPQEKIEVQEEKIEIPDFTLSKVDNINPYVEIALLQEKNNLSLEDLLNMVKDNSRYQYVYQELLKRNETLTEKEIVNILNNTQENRKIFIGDSRMQGMLLSGVLTDYNTIYGVGYGYNWLIGKGSFASGKTNAQNGAINSLYTKVSNDYASDIVIWLGINDYTYRSASEYFQVYQNLAQNDFKNNNIYIVSVGPVSDKALRVNNQGITEFNQELDNLIKKENMKNLKYIDLDFTKDDINKYDGSGLHYGAFDYQKIYNIITGKIEEQRTIEREEVLNFFYSVLKDYDSYQIQYDNSYVKNR